MEGKEQVSLLNLGDGAAAELFDFELSRVLENILDPNTEPEAIREVTLKVKIKPDQDRSFGAVQIQAVSKLAPIKPYGTQFFMGRGGGSGEAEAYEHNPKQMGLFAPEEPKVDASKVVPLDERRKEGSE